MPIRDEWKYASVLNGKSLISLGTHLDPSGTDEKKVSVIGCGVGGLAAAAALDLASEIKVIAPGFRVDDACFYRCELFPRPKHLHGRIPRAGTCWQRKLTGR